MLNRKQIITCFATVLCCLTVITEAGFYNNDLNEVNYQFTPNQGLSSLPFFGGLRRRCPLCDSSVYSYCSEKLFHDSCCCHNPNNPYDRLPYQCQYADCTFLHANSCSEHKLITACCCSSYL